MERRTPVYILLMGDDGAGQYSVLTDYCHCGGYDPTSMGSYDKNIGFDGKLYFLDFLVLDPERIRSCSPHVTPDSIVEAAHVTLLFFDVQQKKTFNYIVNLVENLKARPGKQWKEEKGQFLVVGFTPEIVERPVAVPELDWTSWAKEIGCRYASVEAKNFSLLDDFFLDVTKISIPLREKKELKREEEILVAKKEEAENRPFNGVRALRQRVRRIWMKIRCTILGYKKTMNRLDPVKDVTEIESDEESNVELYLLSVSAGEKWKVVRS